MRRLLLSANLILFLLGVLVIIIVLNSFARQEQWRYRLDGTKTRAYSLSPQTQQLLANLQGQWKIAIVLDQRQADQVNRGMRPQIDEVLSRYTTACPNISVVRIDPGDPRTLVEFDKLLAELNNLYKDSIAAYDTALDAGMQSLAEARDFAIAVAQQGQLERLVSLLPAGDPVKDSLGQSLSALALIPNQAAQVQTTVERARQVDQSRPLPDYETARSVLVAALQQPANDIDELAGTFGRWAQRPNLDEQVKQFALSAQRECQGLSQRLANAADPLKRLPPLELSSIGTQLQQGEAAIIISPKRAAVIPSSQLFPKGNLKRKDDGGVSFDQRFRGEQLISAAIRSLTVEHMPLVVFVHAEEGSLLKPRDKQQDLVGVAQMLRASRFEVAEWMVASQTSRPTGEKGQPVVWVIVPPAPARMLEPTAATAALVDATQKLIADGEPVLLNLLPSLLAKYEQPDPFAAMALPFGIDAQTAAMVMERVSGEEGQTQPSLGQTVRDFSHDQRIGRAVDGQQAYFGMPISLRLVNAPQGVKAQVIASIQPSPDRWLERDWTGDIAARAPSPEKTLREPSPLIVASERPNPAAGGEQRFMAVGSGHWMISNVADVVLDISGGSGRVALINPGNHELMLASVAWLAGMDDLIAASPVSQEIARLRDVTPQERLKWMLIAVAGLPGACVILGIGVWLIRRS